ISVESLPGEILMALVEAFLSRALEGLEGVLGCPVKIADPAGSGAGQFFHVGFQLTFDRLNSVDGPRDEPGKDIDGQRNGDIDRPRHGDVDGQRDGDVDGQRDGDVDGQRHGRVNGFLMVPFNESSVAFMERAFSLFPPRIWNRESILSLEKEISFQAGSLVLKFADLCRLEAGDVLIPEKWYPRDSGMALGMAPHLFLCDYDPGGSSITFTGIEVPASSKSLLMPGRTDMENHGAGQVRNGAGQEGDATKGTLLPGKNSDIELELVFEVGRMTMTIGEISALVPGRVIEMPHRLDEGVPVDIKVNDRAVARGKIVGVGDLMAVQITKLATIL
ncbi:MAG: FliM/FliN family flagellar motor switch protein, partial [Desulfamplus sp.]|nr:FliM/FliN family flagellar motor switch protein [Desulfamplus sp.]